MREAVAGLPLVEASHRIHAGDLRDARTGAVVTWEPIAMALPVTERFRERLDRGGHGDPGRPTDPKRPRYRLVPPTSNAEPVA